VLNKNVYFPHASNFTVNTTLLPSALDDARVIKSPKELELMTIVSHASSDAHVRVMRESADGLYEFQLESFYLHVASYCG